MAYDYCAHYMVHSQTAGAVGGSQDMGVQKGHKPMVHLAIDSIGMPIRFINTEGTTADCILGTELINGYAAEFLLVERDT